MSEIDEKTQKMMDLKTLMITSIISALGFVVALFWNDAIKAAIESIVPAGDTVAAKLVAAVIVTIIVVIVIYTLYRGQRLAEKHMKEITKANKNATFK